MFVCVFALHPKGWEDRFRVYRRRRGWRECVLSTNHVMTCARANQVVRV